MIPRKLTTTMAAIGLILAITACSSGGGSPAAAAKPAASSDAPASEAASTATADPAGGVDDFCTKASGIDPGALVGQTGDPTQLKLQLDSAVAAAPSEIKADFRAVAKVMDPILSGDVPQDQINAALSDPGIVTALEHIATWSATHCAGG